MRKRLALTATITALLAIGGLGVSAASASKFGGAGTTGNCPSGQNGPQYACYAR